MRHLLDTNVLSELRKGSRAIPSVHAWYRAARLDENFVSVLVFGELRYGIERLRGRDSGAARQLTQWFDLVRQQFGTKILPVTLEIADLYGRLCPDQRLPPFDGLMAATALVHDLTLVTRNTRDFERSGARLLNPFVAV